MYLTNSRLAERPAPGLNGEGINGYAGVLPGVGATEINVVVQGIKQGNFKGESAAKGSEGASRVLRFSFGVVSPRDLATGQASGRRQHKPIVITRQPGAASPQFFQALVTNEILPSVAIHFLRPNNQGFTELIQALKLSNALVAEFRQYVGEDGRWLEDVAFAFQKIEIENKPGKTFAADDWRTRLA